MNKFFLFSAIALGGFMPQSALLAQNAASSVSVTHPLLWKYQWMDGNKANTIGSARNSDPLPVPVPVLPPGSYSPANISDAYGYNLIPAKGNGAGKKIAIVDAYGSPTIQSDLNQFCSQFGIQNTTLTIHYMGAQNTTWDSNALSWLGETSLDVEWAHAMAPGANILLVITPDSSNTNMAAGVTYAVQNGANVVSMSWGATEGAWTQDPASFWNTVFTNPAVAYVASSGDKGDPNGVQWPAAHPNVLGVGGTELYYNEASNIVTGENVWNNNDNTNATGGGISWYQQSPFYQTGWNSNSLRGVPDVSAVAAPYTGGYIYYTDASTLQSGWAVYGGTSWSAPQWAGLLACRASLGKAPIGNINSYLYAQATGPSSTNYSNSFRDITVGNNFIYGFGYSANTGYDYCTGLGSPNADLIANPSSVPTPPSPILQQWGLYVSPIPAAATNPGVAAISKSFFNPGSAVLTTTGKVVIWGSWSNYSLTNDIPPDVSSGGVSAISMGSFHMLALKGGGVYAWGDNASGQCNVPSGATNGIVAISAGEWNSLALTSQGTIVGWGLYYTNPLGIVESTIASINATTDIDPVIGISDGVEQGLALMKSGTVRAWGWSFKGGALTYRSAQSDIPVGLSGVVAVSEGNSFAMALKSDGTVVAWGTGAAANVPAGLNGVVAISAGFDHAMAAKSDGTVVAWGNNGWNQTNVPVGLTGVVAVEAGYMNSLSSTQGVGDSQSSGGGGGSSGSGGGTLGRRPIPAPRGDPIDRGGVGTTRTSSSSGTRSVPAPRSAPSR